jgi:vancomycin resistance protein YoaR
MKKLIVFFIAILFVTSSCKKEIVEKPKNLIERSKMVDIIYDLALLEAAKSQTAGTLEYPKTALFLKQKYKVDSLTFAQSTKYYASDMKNYKKMYDEVKERLNAESTKLNGGKPVVPNLEQGVVR